MNRVRLGRLISFVAVILFPISCHSAPEDTLILQFGVNSTDSPMVVGQKFLPVLRLLENNLEARMNRPVRINFRIFRTYGQTVTAFVNGEVDFGRLGPASYVHAKRPIRKSACWPWKTAKAKKPLTA